MLQTYAPVIFSVTVFILMRFRSFSTVYTDTICMRFRFDHLSRAFSSRCVFDVNAPRISVDGRPKRIEMYAFSKRKPISVDEAFDFLSIQAKI